MEQLFDRRAEFGMDEIGGDLIERDEHEPPEMELGVGQNELRTIHQRIPQQE
jgi:hypothetical protein